MAKQEQYQDLLAQLQPGRLPRHIGIIMDGNGRWAKDHGQPRAFGHKAGAEALRRVTEICRELEIPALTVYAFSTENWQRPKAEIDFLMQLLQQYLKQELPLLMKQEVRLFGLGDWQALPTSVQKLYHQVANQTAANSKLTLNLAVNYGSQQEIVRAVQKLARQVAAGDLQPKQIDIAAIDAALDTAGQPELDLIIRPAGEHRLSNFLLWQAAYAELYFTDKYWPDFGKRDLLTAIIDFQNRERRFGGL